eukprot:14753770-Alexandrium_andersonii.AAC.1
MDSVGRRCRKICAQQLSNDGSSRGRVTRSAICVGVKRWRATMRTKGAETSPRRPPNCVPIT